MNLKYQKKIVVLALGMILLPACSQKFTINILPTLELVKPPAVMTAEIKAQDYQKASKVQLDRLALGQRVEKQYALRNTGDFELEIQSLTISDAALSEQIKITGSCGKLAPNKTEVCPIRLTFDPQEVGSFSPFLVAEFKNHLGENKIFRFPIEAEGRSVALLRLKDGGSSNPNDLPSLDFGSVTKDFTGSKLVLVEPNTDKYPKSKNPLSAASSVNFKFGASPSRFSVSTSEVPPNLTACNLSSIGANCYVMVNFNPNQGGNAQVNDSLTVEYNNGSEPAFVSTVSLTGRGIDIVTPPALALQGQAPAFGSVVWSSPQTNPSAPGAADLLIQKSGSGPVLFTGITFPNFVSPAPSGSTCPTTGTSVEMNSNCVYKLLYKPTSAGSLSGQIVLSYKQSANGSTQTVTVAPTGTAVNPALLAFSAPSTSISSRVFQSKSATVTISNSGGFPANVLSITASTPISGLNASLKNLPNQNQDCVSIPAGGSCILIFNFNPQAQGSFSSNFTLTYQNGRDPPLPAISHSFTGIADGSVGPPQPPGTPVEINLGNVMLGGNPAVYSGQGGLSFVGSLTLNFFGGLHASGSKFNFFGGGAGAGTFPGSIPSGAGTSPPLCTTPFSLSASQLSCRFFVGISSTAAADIGPADSTYVRGLTVSYYSDGGTPQSSSSQKIETAFSVRATPRNPSELRFFTAFNSTIPVNSISFPLTIKNVDSAAINAVPRVIVAGGTAQGYFNVRVVSRDIIDSNGAIVTSPFSIASPSSASPNDQLTP
ncbi:MAG: choice-of-anchor D domain-containing protein, partial [Bdellovibrionales bacterium]|nr:choice-of-anchor D domain-containing protein [Bdellovibrionales bacterium]